MALEIASHEVEEFVQGRVWKYILATILARVNTLMEENNQIDPFHNPSGIARNQGIITGMGEIVDLPAIIMEQIEYDKKVKKEEKEDGN